MRGLSNWNGHSHLLRICRILAQVNQNLNITFEAGWWYLCSSIYLDHSMCFGSMSPMPAERWGHSCGLVVDPERGPEVIVMGGYSYPDYVDTVLIYNVDTDTWKEGRETELCFMGTFDG